MAPRGGDAGGGGPAPGARGPPVAIERDEGVVGVSTAYLQHSAQLRMDFWYYRVFVAGRTAIATWVCCAGDARAESPRAALRERGGHPRRAGIVFEIENEGLKRYFNKALWRDHVEAYLHRGERARRSRACRLLPGGAGATPG